MTVGLMINSVSWESVSTNVYFTYSKTHYLLAYYKFIEKKNKNRKHKC